MITLLIAFFTGQGVKNPLVAKILAWVTTAAGVLALLWGLSALWGMIVADHDRAVTSAYENRVEAEVRNQAVAADRNLQTRRDADNTAIAANRQEFDNATASLPRSGLTPRQRLDACRELREQATDKALLARAGCV